MLPQPYAINQARSRKLFVGSLPLGVHEDVLRAEFGRFGRVEDVYVKQNCEPTRQYAFVMMGSPEEAQRAKDGTDRTLVIAPHDRPVDVMLARNQGMYGQDPIKPSPPKPGMPVGVNTGAPPTKILVGSLPEWISEQEVGGAYAAYGQIIDLHLNRKPVEPGRQWCLITYAAHSSANYAKTASDRVLTFPGAERPVEVVFARDQAATAQPGQPGQPSWPQQAGQQLTYDPWTHQAAAMGLQPDPWAQMASQGYDPYSGSGSFNPQSYGAYGGYQQQMAPAPAPAPSWGSGYPQQMAPAPPPAPSWGPGAPPPPQRPAQLYQTPQPPRTPAPGPAPVNAPRTLAPAVATPQTVPSPAPPSLADRLPGFGLSGFDENIAGLGDSVPGLSSSVPGDSVPGLGSSVPGLGSSVPGLGSSVPGLGSSVPDDSEPGMSSSAPGLDEAAPSPEPTVAPTLEPTVPPVRKIFVGALPENVTQDVLTEEFGKYGQVVDIHLNSKPAVSGSNWAFITFATHEEASHAKNATNNVLILPNATAPCEVMMAKSSGKRPRALAVASRIPQYDNIASLFIIVLVVFATALLICRHCPARKRKSSRRMRARTCSCDTSVSDKGRLHTPRACQRAAGLAAGHGKDYHLLDAG